MDISSTEWINACINIMDSSMELGSRIYPLICGLGLISMLIQNV